MDDFMTEHETYTYYGVNGQIVDTQEDCYLYEYETKDNHKYFVKTNDGQLINPLETMVNKYGREQFLKVSEDVFDAYLEYLSNPSSGGFTVINRKVMYNL